MLFLSRSHHFNKYAQRKILTIFSLGKHQPMLNCRGKVLSHDTQLYEYFFQ